MNVYITAIIAKIEFINNCKTLPSTPQITELGVGISELTVLV